MKGLVDAYGREIRTDRPITDEINAGGATAVRNTFSSYPTRGLTPGGLSSIFTEADQGNVRRLQEVYEEMLEKDAHLAAVVQTRALAVAGLEWEVAAASDDSQDIKVAEFVREALKGIPSFTDSIMAILDGVTGGYSVAEIIWSITGKSVGVERIKSWHPKAFTFMLQGGLVSQRPRLITDAEMVYGEELIPNKFIVHAPRGRAPHRAGVLRPCSWVYLFKNYTLKDWVIFNERFAQPMRVGKYGTGASEKEREVLRDAVIHLGSDAAAIISEGTMIEFIESKARGSSAEIYEALLSYCDKSMSKAVLGHTGSSDSTPGKLGSEDMAGDIRRDVLEADAGALSGTVTRDIVRPLVAFNFGPDTAVPVFRLLMEDAEDLVALAESLDKLQGIGVKIPSSYVHAKFGIPEPTDADEVLVRAQGEQQPVETQANRACPCGCDGDHSLMAMSATDPEAEWVERYIASLAPSLNAAHEDALNQVEQYLAGQTTPPSFDEFDNSIQDILGNAYSKVDKAAIAQVVENQYKWFHSTGSLAPEIEVAFGGADVRAVDWLAARDQQYISKYIRTPGVKRQVSDFLLERYHEGGEAMFGRGDMQAVRELKSLLSQKVRGLTTSQVDRIVETSVQRTRNWAHVNQLNGARITEMQRHEPRDACEFCISMHGRVVSVPAAAERIQTLTHMSDSQHEAEFKRKDLQPVLGNEEAFISNAVSDPYHPFCRGRWIKRRS